MKWIYLLTLVVSMNAHAIVKRHDVPEHAYLNTAANDNSTVSFYGMYQGKEIVEGMGAFVASDRISKSQLNADLCSALQ
ncbi:hypothetical protein [Alteromonas halophila]|uniref:Uncharacterized protein n=1 Tax=Alteromonas halophila TaxID=516698 RepID=A0A918JCN3_9ALTE|nr:hypothetical protein [Alteromonas halophila]GGW74885.1 hypothetical protein GCM10007391_03800 [Alteromonas halophila]